MSAVVTRSRRGSSGRATRSTPSTRAACRARCSSRTFAATAPRTGVARRVASCTGRRRGCAPVSERLSSAVGRAERLVSPSSRRACIETHGRRGVRSQRRRRSTVARQPSSRRRRNRSPWFEPRSFVRELACGNVGVWSWLKVSTRAFLYAIVWKLGLRPSGPVHSRSEDVDTSTTLGLKPGDRVRVKSKIEIERTLTDAKTRGLWFDREMLPYCNQTHTVKDLSRGSSTR